MILVACQEVIRLDLRRIISIPQHRRFLKKTYLTARPNPIHLRHTLQQKTQHRRRSTARTIGTSLIKRISITKSKKKRRSRFERRLKRNTGDAASNMDDANGDAVVHGSGKCNFDVAFSVSNATHISRLLMRPASWAHINGEDDRFSCWLAAGWKSKDGKQSGRRREPD